MIGLPVLSRVELDIRHEQDAVMERKWQSVLDKTAMKLENVITIIVHVSQKTLRSYEIALGTVLIRKLVKCSCVELTVKCSCVELTGVNSKISAFSLLTRAQRLFRQLG